MAVRSLPLAILVCVAGEASAGHEVGHVPERPPPSPMTVSLGGGADGFLGGDARSAFGIGGAWSLRVAFGTRSELRAELVYAGSAQPMTDQSGAYLVGHGIQGVLRVNVAPKWTLLEPFFYAGAGWSRYHVTGDMLDGLQSPDHVVEIPVGFGVARKFGRFVLDARAGVSIVSAADLVPPSETSTSTEGQSLHRYGIRATVGIEL